MNDIILGLFSGINIAFALLCSFIFYKNVGQKLYLYFSLFSLFSGLFFLFKAVSGYISADIQLIILFCAAIYYAIFPWFIFEFVGKKSNRIQWLLSSIFALAIAVFILNPDPGNFAIWQILAHIGLVGLMIVAMNSALIFKKMDKPGAKEFVFLSVLFVILGLEEIITNYSGQKFLSGFFTGILPLDIYPLIFTIVVGIRLSNEIFTKNRLKIQLIESRLSEEKLKREELKKERLQNKLHSKSKDLTDFGIEITRKREFTEDVFYKLSALKNEVTTGTTELNELISFTKSHMQIDKNLNHFQRNIDSINHAFISRLKSDFPSLSSNEIHLASLLRLKFNTKEIAIIKNISPDSVKVLRYRIRKKLNLATHKDLSQFMIDLC